MKKMICVLLGLILSFGMMQQVMAQSAGIEKPSWTDAVKLKGYFRYRHEVINKEHDATRVHERIQAKLGVFGSVNDNLDLGLQIASGSSDSPTANNQTLGNAFSSKALHLDLAYGDWHPELVEDLELNVVGGKMKQPWVHPTDLIWDSDVTPEGGALILNYDLADSLKILANGGALWVDENSSDDNIMLYTGQAGVQVSGDNKLKIVGGGTIYYYDSLKDKGVIYGDKFKGNSYNEITDTYLYNYTIYEAFAEAGITLGIPLKLYGNYVYNDEADDDNSGYMIGITVGKASKPFQVEGGVNYRMLEKDAAVDTFPDGSSWGGGTDGEGWKLYGKIKLAKNFTFGASYYLDKKNISDNDDIDETNFRLLDIDLVATF